MKLWGDATPSVRLQGTDGSMECHHYALLEAGFAELIGHLEFGTKVPDRLPVVEVPLRLTEIQSLMRFMYFGCLEWSPKHQESNPKTLMDLETLVNLHGFGEKYNNERLMYDVERVFYVFFREFCKSVFKGHLDENFAHEFLYLYVLLAAQTFPEGRLKNLATMLINLPELIKLPDNSTVERKMYLDSKGAELLHTASPPTWNYHAAEVKLLEDTLFDHLVNSTPPETGDVVFHFSNNTKLKVHRSICARSVVLGEIVNNSWDESQCGVITLPETAPTRDEFVLILMMLYTKQVPTGADLETLQKLSVSSKAWWLDGIDIPKALTQLESK